MSRESVTKIRKRPVERKLEDSEEESSTTGKKKQRVCPTQAPPPPSTTTLSETSPLVLTTASFKSNDLVTTSHSRAHHSFSQQPQRIAQMTVGQPTCPSTTAHFIRSKGILPRALPKAIFVNRDQPSFRSASFLPISSFLRQRSYGCSSPNVSSTPKNSPS